MALTFLSLSVGWVGCGGEDEPAPYPSDMIERDDSGVSRSQYIPGAGTSSSSSGSDDGAGPGEPCGTNSDCRTGLTCFQGTCVGEGALRFSMSWELDTDLDLHVLTPSGTEIFFGNPSGAGGELDVDDCVGSSCREPGGTHVENIYWNDMPPSGLYTFWAHNYAGEFLADFEIEVSKDGRGVVTKRGTVPLAPPFESTRFTYTY